MRERYLTRVLDELPWPLEKMAFISGPRQCGKTTFARCLLKERQVGAYGNWDDIEFRRIWTQSPKRLLPVGPGKKRPLLALDEIHKARGWKRTLKGLFDTLETPCDILVTGSARLNVFKKGGDSLLGRYLHFRLHPFSFGEVESRPLLGPTEVLASLFPARGSEARVSARSWAETLDLLYKFGGFPEPFLRQSAKYARIWRRGRAEKIVREDLRDLSRIPELSQVEMLMALLPERAGGPLSVQSLQSDLEVAHDTVTRWINYLKDLYYVFEVKPYRRSIPRSLKKEGKVYLWDWSEVEQPGPRFENLVACHLLKAVHYWTDVGEGNFDLLYVRNKQKQEIDFLITRDRVPWLAVEAKLSDEALSPSFPLLLPHIACQNFVQVVKAPGVLRHVEVAGKRGAVMSADQLVALLP